MSKIDYDIISISLAAQEVNLYELLYLCMNLPILMLKQ